MNKFLLTLLAVFSLVHIFAIEPDGISPELREKIKKVKYASEEDFALGKKLLAECRKLAARRKRVFGKPLAMAEALSSAGRMWFTDHWYTDRQLFAARDIWEPGGMPQYKKAGHAVTFDLVYKAGFDCVNAFARPAEQYCRNAAALKLDPAANKVIATLCPSGAQGPLRPDVLRAIAASPHTYRLPDGRILIMNWTEVSVKKTVDFIRQVEKIMGQKIAFIESFGTVNEIEDPWIFFRVNGKVPGTILLTWFDRITEYLEVCAGIEFYNRLPTADGRQDFKYYDQVIFPLFLAACSQERFNGRKLFGIQVMTGYNNYRAARSLDHDGTQTIRNYMTLCKKYPVDLIKAFEWDEYREDTHFQPTVNKPAAMQRLMRYCLDDLRGLPPSQIKGDDLSLPNLIISHRKQFCAGPEFKIELLNVPDSNVPEKYSVKLELLDEKGVVIYTAKKLHFTANKLQAHVIEAPGSLAGRSAVLVPRLTLDYKGKTRVLREGLPFAVTRPTSVGERTWLSTPLRNLLFPEKAVVKFGKVQPAGTLPEYVELSAGAELKFKEKLNSAEIMQERYNLYSFDPGNEFLQNDPERKVLRLAIHNLDKHQYLRMSCKASVKGAPSAVWFKSPPDPRNSYSINPTVKAEVVPMSKATWRFTQIGGNWNIKLMSLKRQECKDAVFVIECVYESGSFKGKKVRWECPLAKLESTGLYSDVLPGGLQFALEYPTRMERLPLPLNCGEVKFNTRMRPVNPHGVFNLRVVSRCGKVWWSDPFVSMPESRKKTAEITCFDPVTRKNSTVKVPAERVTRLAYRFNPSYAGHILTVEQGREYYATAGSFESVATAYEGYSTAQESVPGFVKLNRNVAKGIVSAPAWEQLPDKSWCLNFSGQGEFIVFPATAVPLRSGVSFAFEVMPQDVAKNQSYFAHFGDRLNGFVLRTEDGRLVLDCSFKLGRENPWNHRRSFPTSLYPKAGVWQRIEVCYDLDFVTVSLDGKTEKFACTGVPNQLGLFSFGGGKAVRRRATGEFFKGKLRSFVITHGVKTAKVQGKRERILPVDGKFAKIRKKDGMPLHWAIARNPKWGKKTFHFTTGKDGSKFINLPASTYFYTAPRFKVVPKEKVTITFTASGDQKIHPFLYFYDSRNRNITTRIIRDVALAGEAGVFKVSYTIPESFKVKRNGSMVDVVPASVRPGFITGAGNSAIGNVQVQLY